MCKEARPGFDVVHHDLLVVGVGAVDVGGVVGRVGVGVVGHGKSPRVLRYLFDTVEARRTLLAEALGVGDASDLLPQLSKQSSASATR